MEKLNLPTKPSYGVAERLYTSENLGWRSLIADMWRFGECGFDSCCTSAIKVHLGLSGHFRGRRRGDGRLEAHDAAPGTIYISPAGVDEHDIRIEGGVAETLLVYLPGKATAELAVNEFDRDPRGIELQFIGGVRDPVIESLGRSIAAELQAPGSFGRVYVDTLAAALSVHLLRSFAGPVLASQKFARLRGALSKPRLERVLAFIEANLAEDLSLSELAEVSQLSPFHFARAFRAATGHAPHGYVLKRRIDRAADFVRSGRAPLSEIAAACGFSSQAHLTTAFRRHTGLTPGALRQQLRR